MNFEKVTGIQTKREKPSPFNWRRVAAMLFAIALGTGIAVFALDGYSVYEEHHSNNHDLTDYIYENGEGYTGHELYGYEYIDVVTNSAPPASYSAEYWYRDTYLGEFYYSGGGYIDGYLFEDDGFIGAAPEYGYIGFEPLVSNFPPGFTAAMVHNLPANATHAQWEAAVGGPGAGNRIVAVHHSQNMPATVNISGNRHVIVASQGTNLTTHVPPGTTFTQNRTAGTGRHFVVADGATLTLSNIILDGGSPAADTERGGVLVIDASHLIMQMGSIIQNNRAVSYGGGVRMGTGFAQETPNTFTMNGGIIRNNTANTGGGVLNGRGHVIINNGIIENNRAAVGGGAVANTSQSQSFAMHGGIIRDNIAYGTPGNTGGVSIGSHTNIITNGLIYGNTGNAVGGGISVWNSTSTLNIYDVIIQDNRAPDGGGLFVIAGTVNMHGGTIRNNRHSGTNASGAGIGTIQNGGGVYVVGGNSIFRMHGGIIGDPNALAGDTTTGNRALRGGGVWVGNGARFYMQDWLDNYGNVIAVGAWRIVGNEVTGGVQTGDNYGGGVYVIGSNTRFNMSAGIIERNMAHRGHGVAVWNEGRFDMRGTAEIRYHICPPYGERSGTVYVINESIFNMYGSARIHNNEITSFGGALRILNDSEFHMSGNARIHGNRSAGGGAIAATHNTLINMSGNARIHDNFAHSNGQGGGVSSTDGEFNLFGNARIDGNTNTGGGGGGVSVTGIFNMRDNARIENNRTGWNVGGISIQPALIADETIVTITGGYIRNNRYTFDDDIIAQGGGIRAWGADVTLIMTGGIIGDEDPDYGNRAQRGGGVWVQGASFSILGNARIEGNFAHANSAGVHTPTGGSATITMSGNAYIIGNTTSGNGGGITSAATNTFNMYGGVIANNTATFASGVRVLGTFNMTAGEIIANEAFADGGGVWVHGPGAIFTMYGGTIGRERPPGLPEASPNPYANTALSGGGVWVGGGARFYMQDHIYTDENTGDEIIITGTGLIIGNTATHIHADYGGGGAFVTGNGSAFNMSAGTIQNNYAIRGGGVRVMTQAQFNMSGNALIYRNTTFHNYLAHGGGVHGSASANITISDNASISNNHSYGTGGGIHLHTAFAIMHGGTIGHNHAENHIAGHQGHGGGGIQLHHGNAWFEMRGGYIIGNTTPENGGGIWLGSTATFNMYGGTIGGLSGLYDNEGDPIINANTATRGGGVSVSVNATFNLRGATPKQIIGNQANYGGGIWVGENAQMQVQTTPTAAANIHITHNTATYMGGGIYSQNHEYTNPLPPNRIPPPAGTAVGPQIAYSNLSLTTAVTFAYNRANRRYVPPVNFAALPHLAFAGTTTSQPENAVRIHPLNNYDINFRLDDVYFSFYKTDQQIYDTTPVAVPLAGARFRVFRTDANPATTPGLAAGLVTFDQTTGAPNTPWVEVDMEGSHISLGTFTALGFPMTPGFTYQLVEYMAPSGFQIPLGQWRITLSETPATLNTAIFTHIGSGNVPAFVPNGPGLRPSSTVSWLLGNIPNPTLPLTGGEGSNNIVFIGSGTGVIAVALAVILVIKAKKKNPVNDRYTRVKTR
ncbi:MAG: hypothetical protein FWE42_07705 [Defluviitaleaceae bacterium]|nr:hypothetical protein [Defluviitaleaceae bacterium]